MATVVGSSTAYTPAVNTAAEMVRSVLDYIQGGDDDQLQDVALRELNLALDECNARNWKKLLGSQEITLVVSTDAYTLDNAFKAPLVALLTDTTGRRLRLGYEEGGTFLAR